MKAFVVLCVLMTLVSVNGWILHPEVEVQVFRAGCFRECKVTPEQAEDIRNFVYKDEEEVRCSLVCLGKRLGVWNPVDGLNPERLYSEATLAEFSIPSLANMKKCIDARKNGEDDGRWVYRNFICILKNKFAVPKREDN